MKRRTFTTMLGSFFVSKPRTPHQIAADIGNCDKEYGKRCILISKRSTYFEPTRDATIRGWVKQQVDVSEKVLELWKEWRDL